MHSNTHLYYVHANEHVFYRRVNKQKTIYIYKDESKRNCNLKTKIKNYHMD